MNDIQLSEKVDQKLNCQFALLSLSLLFKAKYPIEWFNLFSMCLTKQNKIKDKNISIKTR